MVSFRSTAALNVDLTVAMPRVSHWHRLVSLAAVIGLFTPRSVEAVPISIQLQYLRYGLELQRSGIGTDPGFDKFFPASDEASKRPQTKQTPLPLSSFILPGSDPSTTLDPVESDYFMTADRLNSPLTALTAAQTEARVKADVQLHTALNRAGVPLPGALAMALIATSSYQIVVNKKSGKAAPSDLTAVPIIVGAVGFASCSGRVVAAISAVTIYIPTGPTNYSARADCHDNPVFDLSTDDKFPIGVPASITVQAYGAMDLGVDDLATFDVMADPSFEIDPAFPYADAFEIEYSPGFEDAVAPADVPEPGSLLLLAVGASLTVLLRRPSIMLRGQ